MAKNPTTLRLKSPKTNALPAKERKKEDVKPKRIKLKRLLRRRKECEAVVRSLAKPRRPLCLFSVLQLMLVTFMSALTLFGLLISSWSAFLYRAPTEIPDSLDVRILLPLSLLSPQSPTSLYNSSSEPSSALSPPAPSLPFTDSRTFFWLFFLFNGHFLVNLLSLYEVITSKPVNLCAYTSATADHLLYLFLGDLLCLSWTATVHLWEIKVDQLKSTSMEVLVFGPGAICLARLLLTVAFVLHFNATFSSAGTWRWLGTGCRHLPDKPKNLKKTSDQNSHSTRQNKKESNQRTRKISLDTGKSIKIRQNTLSKHRSSTKLTTK